MTPEQMMQFPPATVTLKNEECVVVRVFREADGDGLADLYESVPREDARFYRSPSTLNRSQALDEAAMADGPWFVGLVIERKDGEIAGYAYYRWESEDSDTSRFGICIRRNLQGSGAGKELMNRLIEMAGLVGPPIMSLHVQVANERAVALYKQMGFVIVREQIKEARDGFDAEPEYYMERRVR